MRYIALIYTNEANDMHASEADQKAVMDAYFAFTNEANEAGVNKGGEALHPTATATTVRVRDGQTLTTDGPFAETKEQLGGFYMIEADNLDEAIHWAAKIPGAAIGSVEVRPIVEWN